MSEVAERMSVQVGAHYLETEQGGRGVLLGGVPGVPAAKVVVLGGGVAGTNAARMAMGLEAWVTVIDKSLPRLYELDLQFGSELHTLYSTVENIENEVLAADLVIGRPKCQPMINHVAIVAVPQQRRAPKGVSVVRTGLGGPIPSRRRAPCPSISCPTSP